MPGLHRSPTHSTTVADRSDAVLHPMRVWCAQDGALFDGADPPPRVSSTREVVMLGAEFGVGQVVWSLLWFFLFLVWVMLLFRVFGDIFRSTDMRGATKVLWVLFVIVLPYLGVFCYLIARGDKIAAREADEARAYEESVRQYIRDAAAPSSTSSADELEHLDALRQRGVIDDAEFTRLKAKVLG